MTPTRPAPNRLPHSTPLLLALLTLTLTLLLPSNALASPFPWRWSHPTPHGNNILDLAQFDGSLIQVAEKGRLYASTNLATWTLIATGTTRALRAATVFNNLLLVTGEEGTIVSGASLESLTATNLPTSDWLEGVASSPSLVVAAGDNGAIYTSPDGAAWTRRAVPFTTWLRSITYGASRFVTVGEDGFIATSPNGSTWSPRPSGTSAHLNRVLWTGSSFFVAGDSGTLLASPDGLAWSPLHSGATNDLLDLAFYDHTLIAVGDGEVRRRDFSTATGWIDELAPTKAWPAPDWTYYSVLADRSGFLLGGRSGLLVDGFRTNALSDYFWLPNSDSPRNWLWDLQRVGPLFVAVGDLATLLTSTNGVLWNLEATPTSTTNAVFLGVGGSTNLLVAVGTAGHIVASPQGFTNLITTNLVNGQPVPTTNTINTFGIVWSAPSARPTTNDLQGVAAFGPSIVVSGGQGTILASTNGHDWSPRTTPTSAFLSGLAPTPHGLVAVGQSGTLLSSTDSFHWTPLPSPTTNWLYRVRAAGPLLVAVGQNGTLLTSPDGLAWTPSSPNVNEWLNDVAYVGDTWFVVGNHGTVLASTNATSWTSIGTITAKSLYGAATHQGRLLIAGYEGVILRAQVVPDLTPVIFENYSHTPLANPTNVFMNLFRAAGNPDQHFYLDTSTNLVDWTPGPLLEITDPTGTLIFYETITNPPPSSFSRSRVIP